MMAKNSTGFTSTGISLSNFNYTLINIVDLVNISSFESFFDDLPVDSYLSGGLYRRRRFSRFTIDHNGFHHLEHQQPVQSSSVNVRVDDIPRSFADLDERLIQLADFDALLGTFANLALPFLRSKEKYHKWTVELGVHQIRIVVQNSREGAASSEGIHQDGVDLVGIVCIKRENIIGGVTRLYQGEKEPPFVEVTLRVNELLLFNDRTLFRYTNPAETIDERDGVHDIFVITAVRMPPSSSGTR